MRRLMGIAVGLAVAAAGPAEASCWTPREVSAARVKELDTKLMVAALQCRNGGSNMFVTYNAVVARHRTVLAANNEQIRAHFTAAVGLKAMVAAYDSYVTRVANRYGAATDEASCGRMTIVAQALLDTPSSNEALDAQAQNAAIDAVAVDEQCNVTLETIVIAEAMKTAGPGVNASARLAMVPLGGI